MFEVRFGAPIFLGVLAVSQPGLANDRWSGLSIAIGVGSTIDVENAVEAPVVRERLTGGRAGTYSDVVSLAAEDNVGFGSLQIAYDQSLIPWLIVGAFADVDFGSGIDNSETDIPVNTAANPANNPNTAAASVELKNAVYVGGRIGVLITPNFKPFVAGGYARTSVEGFIDFPTDNANVVRASLDGGRDGYFVGGGADWAVTENLSLRLEYRYADFDEKDLEAFGRAANGNNEFTIGGSHELVIQSARASLVFQLN